MPPKDKKKGKKKKKDDAELELEDKYKRTVDEIEALKDQLVVRKELRRRARSSREEYKIRMNDAEMELSSRVVDHKMTSANMTRQYKSMQGEMTTKVHSLERDLLHTQQKLLKVETQLRTTMEEKESVTREKDKCISDLQDKLQNMERAFENILHESLDKLLDKLLTVRNAWEEKSMKIQAKNKHQLLEFGLNPLEI